MCPNWLVCEFECSLLTIPFDSSRTNRKPQFQCLLPAEFIQGTAQIVPLEGTSMSMMTGPSVYILRDNHASAIGIE